MKLSKEYYWNPKTIASTFLFIILQNVVKLLLNDAVQSKS